MVYKDIEKKRKYNRERHKKKLEENPNYYKEEYNKIKNTKNYKESHKKRNNKYYKKYPDKVKAKDIALRNIQIKKGELCEICKKNLAKHRHHPDYSKPLNVVKVCIKCHNNIHKEKIRKENCSENIKCPKCGHKLKQLKGTYKMAVQI